MISLTFVRKSNCSHGPVGRQQGSEAVGTGSNPSLYLHFFNSINATENRDTPPPPPLLCMIIFETRIFSETRKGAPAKFFGSETKFFFDGKT